MKKICLIASGGGHLEQINQLTEVMEKNECFIVTQKTKATNGIKTKNYLLVENTRQNNFIFLMKMIYIAIQSIYIFIKERPDIIISTGAGVTIPMCYIGKLFFKKIIFIESFAKINTPSKTGKLIYPIADLFIIQWEELKKYYPNAVYGGGIY